MGGRFKRLEYDPSPSDSEGMAILKCSSDNTTVTIHAVLLAHHSRFFRQILNNQQESKVYSISIPEKCDGISLRLFADWVYKGKHIDIQDYAFEERVRSWAFGDHIQAPTFQNDVMDTLSGVSFYINYWDQALAYPWDDAPSGSAMESLFLHMMCYYLASKKDEIQTHLGDLPAAVAQKLLRFLLQDMPGQGTNSFSRDADEKLYWHYGKCQKFRVEEEDYGIEEDRYEIEGLAFLDDSE
ncbi:hypothetical protein GGR51DRAFT_570556 [Nemania sp. FL0031]|nr:hypothetical protein GGR51DRAFT_570556 [Nemania sp. FL0031]